MAILEILNDLYMAQNGRMSTSSYARDFHVLARIFQAKTNGAAILYMVVLVFHEINALDLESVMMLKPLSSLA